MNDSPKTNKIECILKLKFWEKSSATAMKSYCCSSNAISPWLKKYMFFTLAQSDQLILLLTHSRLGTKKKHYSHFLYSDFGKNEIQ